MRIPSLHFLLPFLAATAVAGCNGSGNQGTLPVGTATAPLTVSETQSAVAGARALTQSVAVATAVPSGTYWSGTVSAVGGGSITANCGQSNFAAGYGCLNVTTTGATISGSPVVGQYFQMWGDLSKLPAITATTINYSATVYPVTAPTAAPAGVATATATPISAPGGTYDGFANAADFSSGFRPYASTSIWNVPVSSHPTYLANSAQITVVQFANGQTAIETRSNEAGQYDYDHPRFFATASDPLVNTKCTQYCGAPDNGGVPSQIHIPAVARPAGGGDGHFDIVQPDGTEITMWAAASPDGTYHTTVPMRNWKTGDTVAAANISNCGNFTTGQGWLANGPGPTAAGYCDDAGVTTAGELLAGSIPHALFISGNCVIGAQYPIENGATTHQCTSGVGPPLGAREWYDVSCATTQAQGLPNWETAELCALNLYGAYVGDVGGGGEYFTGGLTGQVESDEPWYDYHGSGYTSPFAALASQGWSSGTISNVYGNESGTRWWSPSGFNPGAAYWQAHIHWLAPCSAQRTC